MNSTLYKEDIKEEYIQLYSFDIFDTLITRTTAYPTGIFTIMQKILQNNPEYNIPHYLKENFFTIRVESEVYARDNNRILYKKNDVTLDDIYKVIQVNYFLLNEQIEQLKNLEINCEIKNIKPIEKNINILKDLINSGRRVILISDMYHSEDVIRKFLVHVDDVFKNIKIYVSSNYFKTKQNSELYKLVQEQEAVQYGNWLHYGDNIHVDIHKSKCLGIKAIFLPQEKFMPYEMRALRTNVEDFYIQSLIGLSRLTRRQSSDNSKAYRLGCSFAGPILYNYVNWLIEQAVRNDFRTLYFIARDGYILKLIADVIIQQKKIQIKTKYIYGSRIAWRIPDENNIDSYLDFMCDEYHAIFTLKFLANRLGIDIERLKNISHIKNEDKILSPQKIFNLKQLLINSTEFKQYLVEINKNKKDLLVKYLKQEIDFSEKQIVFVDLNGSGRTQDMLKNIVKDFYSGDVLGFFYHTCATCVQNDSKKMSFISTRRYFSHVIELFCRAKDGQTIGYEYVNSKICPILEDSCSKEMDKWGYDSYITGILDFSRNISIFELNNKQSIISFNLYKSYFNYFTKSIDKEFADLLGSIPYSDVGNEKINECAPKFGFIDLIKQILFKNTYKNTLYISYARSDKIFKDLKKVNDKYGSVRKFLIDIYFSRTKKRAYIRILGVKVSFSWGKRL